MDSMVEQRGPKPRWLLRRFFSFRVFVGLYAYGGCVVVVCDGSQGADDGESAFGLGLVCPWIGKCPPPCLEFGESVCVAGDGDTVFIDFKSFGNVHHGGDLYGRASALIPGTEGCTVAKVVEKRSATKFSFIEPTVGFSGFYFFGGGFYFVGDVPERASVSVWVRATSRIFLPAVSRISSRLPASS